MSGRSIRNGAALALLALATGCGEPIAPPEGGVGISVEAPAEVAAGAAFPVTVRRVRPEGYALGAFHDELLAPLEVRLVEARERTSGGYVEEMRVYSARLFRPGDAVIPPILVEARPEGGGSRRVARGEPVRLAARGEVDPENPGPPEAPGPLPGPERSVLPAVAAAAAVLLALLFAGARAVLDRRRRPAAPPPPEEASPTAVAIVLGRLADLRRRRPVTDADVLAFHVDLAIAVRDYAAARFDLPALRLTTEELVAACPARAALGAALAPCDLVKFARSAPDEEARNAALGAAERFVADAEALAPEPAKAAGS